MFGVFSKSVSRSGQEYKRIRALLFAIISCSLCVGVIAHAQLGDGDTEGPPIAAFEPANLSAELASSRGGGVDILGDSVNLSDGGMSFSHTDVSIPGNSALPVAFSRFHTIGGVDYHSDMNLGGWNVDVPFVTARIAVRFGWADDRCTGNPRPRISNDPELNDQAWSGVKIFTQGNAGRVILHDPNGGTNVFGTTVPKKTTDDHWRIDCTTSVTGTGGTGEGFIATSPAGMKYTFDYLNKNRGKSLPVNTGGCGDQLCEVDPESSIPTEHWNFYATEIVDVHGNWVRYDYDAGKLTRIHSNDLREITIQYTGDQITSVTANGRVWTYDYATDNSDGGRSLTKVILPDARYWEFDLVPQLWFQKGYPCNSGGGRTIVCPNVYRKTSKWSAWNLSN